MKSSNFNNVQTDKQWRRRCQQEEMQLLDSYAGPKAHKIQSQITLQNSQHFYSNGARIRMPAKQEESKVEQDSVRSKVSVMTPATSVKAPSEYSYRSSATSTNTAKLQMEQMRLELEAERDRRARAEAEVAHLRGLK